MWMKTSTWEGIVSHASADCWHRCRKEQDKSFRSVTFVDKCDVIHQKGQERSKCPHDGNKGRVLDEMDTWCQGWRETRRGKNQKKIKERAQARAWVWEQTRLKKNGIGKNSIGGTTKKWIEGREEETEEEMGNRGEREDVKWEHWWRRRGLAGGMMEKNEYSQRHSRRYETKQREMKGEGKQKKRRRGH